MMDQEPPRQERSATGALIERDSDGSRDAMPVLFRTEPNLRSPLVDHHVGEVVPRGLGSEGPTLLLPPARAFIRPAAWAIVVAAPLLVLIGWQVAAVLGALAAVARELDARFRRANVSFAQGFLPFRDRSAWPRGVQEEDEVHWNWSPRVRNRPA